MSADFESFGGLNQGEEQSSSFARQLRQRLGILVDTSRLVIRVEDDHVELSGSMSSQDALDACVQSLMSVQGVEHIHLNVDIDRSLRALGGTHGSLGGPGKDIVSPTHDEGEGPG